MAPDQSGIRDNSESTAWTGGRPLGDLDIFRASSFLADLVGDGTWHEASGPSATSIWGGAEAGKVPSLKEFRKDIRQMLDDPEEALLTLRRLRVRTLLNLARADLEGTIKPHQVRARLRRLSEALVQGAWWVAEAGLRERYVHPLILERKNTNPPLAICSLSRLGSGEPWYTTGPSPIFVHSRAAEFAPALTEKDFELARRSGKSWTPARDYFHSLARRTMSYLSVPDPAGKGFARMAEDHRPEESPALLPGTLVVLFSAFEEHFLARRPTKERLALMRLRFLVGQEKLGRAVERAAREALMRTAGELGTKLRAGVNSWYRDRARAEGMPLIKGGLLDIERGVRLAQFRVATDDINYLEPSPVKSLDRLATDGIISGDVRLALNRAHGFQWFVANRMALLGLGGDEDWKELRAGRLDRKIGIPDAAERLKRETASARAALREMTREPDREADS